MIFLRVPFLNFSPAIEVFKRRESFTSARYTYRGRFHKIIRRALLRSLPMRGLAATSWLLPNRIPPPVHTCEKFYSRGVKTPPSTGGARI
jgi:hypothetical protein